MEVIGECPDGPDSLFIGLAFQCGEAAGSNPKGPLG